jgi:hypothetical protein
VGDKPVGTEFHRTVLGHLRQAAELVPEKAPMDMFDVSIGPMMQQLDALNLYLFEIGREQLDMEQRETSRERKLFAKALVPDIERLVMRLDERTQRMVEAIATPATAGMFVDLFVDACVQFLDAVPAAAFAEYRVVPKTFPSRADDTVAAIIMLMRERCATRERAR